jgi:hypothetical protein
MVAARRSVLLNSGIELGEIFTQHDVHHTGFVSRSTFATLLRDYSIPMPETTLHFLMIQLAQPSDTTSVSYVRFLEMTDVGVARSASPHHRLDSSPPRFSSWSNGRYVYSPEPRRKCIRVREVRTYSLDCVPLGPTSSTTKVRRMGLRRTLRCQ